MSFREKGRACEKGLKIVEEEIELDLYELITNSVFVSAISTLLGSALTYLGVKKRLSIKDREQLSKDQYQLISEMRSMMQEQRDEIEHLREEIRQLQEVNVHLMIENKELQANIAALNKRLSKLDPDS